MHRSYSAVLLLVGSLAAIPGAASGGPPKATGPVPLRDAKIDDKALPISVPISADSSLVVTLPEHCWINSLSKSTKPASLEGDGVCIHFMSVLADGGYAAIVYIGSVPLPESNDGETPDGRVDRGIAEFISTLGDKYKRLAFQLVTAPDMIKTKKTTVLIDGRKVPATRATTYNTRASSNNSRTNLLNTCDGLFVNVAGSDRLVYVVLDSIPPGTTIEKLTGALSVQRTSAPSKKPRAMKIVETAMTAQGKGESRLAAYEDPPGFAPNYATEIRMEFVWAEDRRDDAGRVTAGYRIKKRAPGEAPALDEEGKLQMKLFEVEVPGTPKKVRLATPGAEALVYSYKTKFSDEDSTASTAVFLLDDQIWAFTWYALGDEVHVKADQLAFERLLVGLQIAVR